MKSLKYIIISLLVVTICKRVTPSDQEPNLNKSELAQQEMDTRVTKESKKHAAHQEKLHKKRYKTTIKKYNPEKRTATVDNIYVGVYEYDRAVTPPNITIPAMVAFGTITEKDSTKKKDFPGGKLNIKTLWGIPVTGHRIPIKKLDRNLTTGYLWLDQDLSLGLTQMNDGKTFVGVKSSHKPNYVSPGNYGPGGTGPVWTWYSGEESQELEQKYGISKPSSDNIKEIGESKINRQRYKLYGIELPDLDHQVDTKMTIPSSFTSKFNTFKTNPFALRNDPEGTNEVHPLILSLINKYLSDNKK